MRLHPITPEPRTPAPHIKGDAKFPMGLNFAKNYNISSIPKAAGRKERSINEYPYPIRPQEKS